VVDVPEGQPLAANDVVELVAEEAVPRVDEKVDQDVGGPEINEDGRFAEELDPGPWSDRRSRGLSGPRP